MDKVEPSEMQPSHRTHPITLSPVAIPVENTLEKPRFKQQAGERFRLNSTVTTVRTVCSPLSFTALFLLYAALYLLQILPVQGNLAFIKHKLHNSAAAGR